MTKRLQTCKRRRRCFWCSELTKAPLISMRTSTLHLFKPVPVCKKCLKKHHKDELEEGSPASSAPKNLCSWCNAQTQNAPFSSNIKDRKKTEILQLCSVCYKAHEHRREAKERFMKGVKNRETIDK